MAATVANAAGGKKGGGYFTVGDMLPPWLRDEQPRKRKTWSEVMLWLKGYTIAGGGKVNGKRAPKPEIPAAKRRREQKGKR